MNYEKIYHRIIDRARCRPLQKGKGHEIHHIVPKCLGGTNRSSNLVLLTSNEHFVCHQLLVRMYPNVRNIVFALIRMTGGGNGRGLVRTNKTYSWIRRNVAKVMKDRMESLGDAHPMRQPETAAKVSKALKGRLKPHMKGDLNFSKTDKFRKSMTGESNPAKRPETRKKLSAAIQADRSKSFTCLETGTLFATYQEAADWLQEIGYIKASRSSLSTAIRKPSGKYHGFTFKFLDSDNALI